MTIDWACAGAPLAGQSASGDRAFVAAFPGGALAAVIDGLGHGPEASVAAQAAERVLRADPTAPVEELVQRCHRDLRGTRGVVLSVASFDARAGQMTWLGVGNVEAYLLRHPNAADASEQAISARGGTVGYLLPPLVTRSLRVDPGDTLVLATDGIRHGFKSEVLGQRTPQQIADAILRLWGTGNDDACVLVARYVGAA